MKKNVSIQVIRIISMLFVIIGCHLLSELNSPVLAKMGQFFNVGVFIFFFISGYLFGKKKIDNYKKWYLDRFKKIIIPVYIFVFVYFAIAVILNKFHLQQFINCILNLEYYLGAPVGLGHLWFITIILLCYICTPVFKHISEKYYKSITMHIIGVIIAIITSYIHPKLGRTMFYLYTYFLGINFKFFENFRFNKKAIILLAVFSLIIRLIGNYFWDNTIFYDIIIYSLTQTIIGICVFIYFFKFIAIKENKVINYMDSISFYLYITHYVFMVGPVRLMGMTNSMIANMCITLICGIASAIILMKIHHKILERLR